MMQVGLDHAGEQLEDRAGELRGNEVLRHLHVCAIGSDERDYQADELVVL